MPAAYAVAVGRPSSSSGDETDAALDDQAVMAVGDDVAEAHAPDGVEGQPRLHSNLDGDAVDSDRVAERFHSAARKHRSAAGAARDRDVVVAGHRRGVPSGELLDCPLDVIPVEGKLPRRLEHAQHIARAGRELPTTSASAPRRSGRSAPGRVVHTLHRSAPRARSVVTISRPIAWLSRIKAGAYSSTSGIHA